MSRTISAALGSATKVPVTNIRNFPDTGTGRSSTDNFCESENRWFVEACEVLITKDAGLALHILTGWDERACYRYAAGHSKSSSNFFRSLLRSPQGRQWLSAAMDGSTESWWLEEQSLPAKLADCQRELRELQEKVRALLPS